jgi:hypothetical protein
LSNKEINVYYGAVKNVIYNRHDISNNHVTKHQNIPYNESIDDLKQKFRYFIQSDLQNGSLRLFQASFQAYFIRSLQFISSSISLEKVGFQTTMLPLLIF